MTIAGVVDTHAALWYLFSDARLSNGARQFIQRAAEARSKIALSSISLVEVVYLIEKGRVSPSVYEDLSQALADLEHVFVEAALSSAIVQEMQKVTRAEVPDMPDRIVAATAVYLGVPIIRRDGRVSASSLATVW